MTKKERQKKKRAELVKAGLAGKRGPKRSVTMAVVERVGIRISKGIPLDFALALEDEDISVTTFQKALETEPKLSTHLTRFKAKFIEIAVTKLSEGEMADLKWLLVRRHPDIFAMPSEKAESKDSGEKVADGLQELLNRSRELARLQQEGET